jgi:hypothetical protein
MDRGCERLLFYRQAFNFIVPRRTWRQGCQIFLDATYQNGEKYQILFQITINITVLPQNIPNGHKDANILHCKTHQNLPSFEFLVLKYAIWQPCSAGLSARFMYIKVGAVKVATIVACHRKICLETLKSPTVTKRRHALAWRRGLHSGIVSACHHRGD